MAITEILILKLQDAATFNPMAILELLRQMVTTYSHTAGLPFKAYQEKEDYSKFYVIGGWPSSQAHDSFGSSDMYKRLWALLGSTLKVDSAELLELSSEAVTSMPDPVVAIERHALRDDKETVDQLSKGVVSTVGGISIDSNVYIAFTGMRVVPKSAKSLEGLDEHMRSLTLEYSIRHIEVNQFI